MRDANGHRYRHRILNLKDCTDGAAWLVYTPARGPGLEDDLVQRGRFWTMDDALAFAGVMDRAEGRDIDAPRERWAVESVLHHFGFVDGQTA